jgi:3-methyladenine DNA glycosylase AlkD
MEGYMKNKFKFLGIKAVKRLELFKEVVKEHSNELKNDFKNISLSLYQLHEREFHMCAIEIFFKYGNNKYHKQDIDIIEHFLVTNSWWDSVDFIAKKILGNYLLLFTEEIDSVTQKFSNSLNIWLIRSSIIFQLGYKDKTDEELLINQCLKHWDSEEFFIQKAIGWALREYGKTNPKNVVNFINSNSLKPLSHREAVRNFVTYDS